MQTLKANRAETIFAGMRNARVAVIGDLMLDRYVWGDVERISPEAPVPIINFSGESVNLGGAANVGANVGALGAEVQLFGVIGDDPEGEQLRKLLLNGGFGDAGISVSAGRPTSIKTRIIAQNQHIVRIDRESKAEIDQSLQRSLLVRFRTALGGVSAVILEDYNKGVLTPHLIREIIDSCNEAHVPVGVDPKQDNFWEYKGVTLFKPNLREIELALGRDLSTDEAVTEAGEELMDRLELKYLLITRGAQGMALLYGDKVKFIPTRARRVHDVSGAGDTVIATIMTALGGDADINEAALLANYAAGIVIAEVGAVPIDVEDLQRACTRR